MKSEKPWLQSITLQSPRVTLAPLEHRHCEELIDAVKDGELFKLWYTAVPTPEIMEQAIERRLNQKAAGATLPFVIINNATGKAVGMTNYLNIDAANRRVEIAGPGIARACSGLTSTRRLNFSC
jgi:N-acetyltransferase